MAIKLPRFGRFIDALHDVGVETNSARGFWGGVNRDDDIVVTAWIGESCEKHEGECPKHGAGCTCHNMRSAADGDRWPIWKPATNHGGLRDAWDTGRIVENATVRVIMVRPREKGVMRDAGLLPGRWRVVERSRDNKAIVEPITDQAKAA